MGREATLEIFHDRRVLGVALLEAKRDFLAVIGNPKCHYDYATADIGAVDQNRNKA